MLKCCYSKIWKDDWGVTYVGWLQSNGVRRMIRVNGSHLSIILWVKSKVLERNEKMRNIIRQQIYKWPTKATGVTESIGARPCSD